MPLKKQDVLVLLELALLDRRDEPWTFAGLAELLGLSASEVHGAVERLEESELLRRFDRKVRRESALEFLVHGLKYCFPAKTGSMTRGMPTSYAAPPLDAMISSGNAEPAPVWPDANGKVRGIAFEPLYRSVPRAAASDPELYELLALVDAIRSGSARERELAARELEARLLRNA